MNTRNLASAVRPALIASLFGLAMFGSAAQAAEVSRTPFQQYVFANSCQSGGYLCKVNFLVVPSKSRLEITNVSCYFQIRDVNHTPSIDYAQLLVVGPSGAIVSASTLAPTFVGFQGGLSTNVHSFAANQAVFVYANAGQHFQVLARAFLGTTFLAGVGSPLACHISGQMVKLS